MVRVTIEKLVLDMKNISQLCRRALTAGVFVLTLAGPLAWGPAVWAGHPAKTSSAGSNGANPGDLVATAVAAGQFKTLAAALGAAGLVEALQGEGPFTVLAPTDAAFAKLPKGTVESLLLPENKAKLVQILKYHVLAGRVSSRQVAGLESAPTLAELPVKISLVDGQLRVNEARVQKTDVAAANGVIHVIDRVLLPPEMKAEMRPVGSPRELIALAVRRGVPLFNQGSTAACAAVYEVAALSLIDNTTVPVKARDQLGSALARAAKQGDDSERAWTLRRALDSTAEQLN